MPCPALMRGAGPRPGLTTLIRALPCFWLVACAGAGHAPRSPATTPGTPIYVVSNGWHSAVVVEADRLPPGRWPQRAAFHGRRYLEVAWGDRDAFPADRMTVRLALQAAFASRGSVLLVAAFDEPLPERFRGIDVVELRVSASALDGLAGFIEASHAGDTDGRPIRLKPGEAGLAAFYLARGRFHVMNTCNSWTARALQAAGLPLRPALTLTAHHLMQQVTPLGRLIATGP
jgi:uncharacterized protein (TIGR02117 family)